MLLCWKIKLIQCKNATYCPGIYSKRYCRCEGPVDATRRRRSGDAHTTLARHDDIAEQRLGLKALIRSTQGHSVLDLDRNAADIAIRYQNEPQQHLIGQRIGHFVESAQATPEVAACHARGSAVKLIAWTAGGAFAARARALGPADLAIGYTCADGHAPLALAEAGLGIAILTSLAAGTSARMRPLSDKASVITLPIWVLAHPDLADPRASARSAVFWPTRRGLR